MPFPVGGGGGWQPPAHVDKQVFEAPVMLSLLSSRCFPLRDACHFGWEMGLNMIVLTMNVGC